MKYVVLSLVITLLSWPAVAEEGFYGGVKLGTVAVDEDEIDDLKNTQVEIDNAGLGGLILGYDFGGPVSLEIEASGSEHDLHNVPGYDELEIGLLGMYVSYRSRGPWYIKARGGLLARSLDIHPSSPAAANIDEDNDAFVSLGFGGGVRVDRVLLEAEITSIEKGIGSFGFVGLYRF